MNSYDITQKLYSKYQNFNYKLQNTYVFSWESDFFCVSTSGYVYEIEVKVSKADFKVDFSKRLALKGNPFKHDYLVDKTRVLRPHKFFFACPEGLIKKDEICDEYGLIWVPERGDAYIVKEAKFLHKEDLFKNLYFVTELMKKYYYRYLETIRQLEIRQVDMKYGQNRMYDKHLF